MIPTLTSKIARAHLSFALSFIYDLHKLDIENNGFLGINIHNLRTQVPSEHYSTGNLNLENHINLLVSVSNFHLVVCIVGEQTTH